MRVPRIVLAGGKASQELQNATGQTNRALVVVNGKTLLAHVVEALRAADPDAPITVVGDVPESADYTRLPDAGDFVSNVNVGVAAYPDAAYVLFSTSDLPFLTGETVADFARGAVARAEETGAGMIYPVVPVASCYARFPGVHRTSLRLREGEFTGGNLMLVRPAFLLSQKQRLAEAFAARKRPFRLAMMLGPANVLRLALSQKLAPGLLSIPFLEKRVSKLVGAPARALICDRPEIATDLDRVSDFEAVGLSLPPLPTGSRTLLRPADVERDTLLRPPDEEPS